MTASESLFDELRLQRLLVSQRWAALGTLDDGVPYVSWVAFVLVPELPGVAFHLSRLALHTRNLLANPNISLALTEPDGGHVNPQQLARLSLQGHVRRVARETSDYAGLRERYLARFPKAAPMFGFGDFDVFMFLPHRGRYVEGFGRTHEMEGEVVRGVMQKAGNLS